ncbi:CRISPR-associated protein [Corynebacterium striatum]|uniref:type I-E CRISPR-associated protein Cse1/CasA n=1 Tax=Corynebacterium striatum TaxID=43770 RepID=UPI0006687910|nr:type I-E CRISPR-associated protein Cse1/CasA [Corynebacterium striatum]VFB06065.1 CRISPR-associated protein [Corynebacterium striatum]HAT1548809.1 type I-E CRISPR-associated protein Cse1/CasA [Corynebacterium striatum]HCD3017106.1 type I-E CRISPR-associated protein Cse1/CasA [Corynebacterium striatum]
MTSESPNINCLTDVEFLPTSHGRLNVRDALLRAHKHDFDIISSQPGFHFSSQVRLLAGIAAVVLRHEVKTPAELLNLGLSEAAVDKALEELSAGAYLHDSQFPFMQRPAVNTSNPKDKATYVGPGTHPVKKLSPAMPPNESEDFANLLTASQERLSLEDAVMWLVTYHHLSVAGNNAYCGDKCVSGSPAMRFVGTENSATEVLWHGQSLLETLLMAIPQSWVKGTGLPAWADRTCAYSRHDGIVHPLWSATWTSNSPATAWEASELVGVRTGGVPPEWFLTEMGSKDQQKDWWTLRNQKDPFYLYINNGKELKLQRLDLGKDATALAINWAAQNKTAEFEKASSSHVLPPTAEARLVFIRHRMEGTASSPNIRASEVFFPRDEEWAHDTNPGVQADIRLGANCIDKLHSTVIRPFRRENANERAGGKVPLVLDFLESSRGDVSEAFWRNMSHNFSLLLKECRSAKSEFIASPELRTGLHTASMAAFDSVTQPYFGQEPARIAHVRAGVEYWVRRHIKDFVVEDPDSPTT